jgi:hypothetical protein
MTYHVSQFCPQTWEIALNDEQNPIDRLKTSALRADRIILFLSIWVETREGHTYANHHL